MNIYRIIAKMTLMASAILLVAGCDKKKDEATPQALRGTSKKTEYTFALVAKSQSNPVFQAARVGAEDAAAELGKKLGVKINILWSTPNEDDAQKQVEYIEQLVLQGVDGISVSGSEAETLTPAINKAVDQGVAVIGFDSDATARKRRCYHCALDTEYGAMISME